ncbi:MAG: major facilitator superfamily domain-containing protein [Monoraphidium minutum]|nr:MAG: major facilitator superfamily domain-containing protein [Monoraphidium minutum]
MAKSLADDEQSITVACKGAEPDEQRPAGDGAGAKGGSGAAAAAALRQPEQPITRSTALACCVGLLAGLSFGYEPPLVSGIVVMEPFTHRFFPGVAAAKRSSPYCAFSDPWIQLYIAGIFLPSLAASLAVGRLSQRLGRRAVIGGGAALLLVANVLQATARSLAQVVAGRGVMGLAQGALTQAAPVFMAEAVPAGRRAAFGALFSTATSVGQLAGYVVNTLVGREINPESQLWRVPFAALTWVSVLLLGLMAVLPDTPSSLLLRGYPEDAKAAFDRFRHPDDPRRDEEWRQAQHEAETLLRLHKGSKLRRRPAAAGVAGGGATGAAVQGGRGRWWPRTPALLAPRNLPALAVTVHMSCLRAFNGFVTVMFLTSAILAGAGASTTFALVGQTLVGVGNLLGSALSFPLIKRVGRRRLLPWASLLMAALWAGVAVILAVDLPDEAGAVLSPGKAGVLIGVLVAWQVVYWCSWSPAFWSVISEVNPLETRATAAGVAQAMLSLSVFTLLATNLSMLCAMRWGMAVLFAAVCAYLGAFWALFTVDTQSAALQDIPALWAHHWFWRRVVTRGGSDARGGGGGKEGVDEECAWAVEAGSHVERVISGHY